MKSIAKNIKINLIEKEKDIKWLAKSLNTSPANIYALLKNLENGKGANIKSIEKIALVLEIKLKDLID